MESLPIEILEKIFRDERLDFVDLSRLSRGCKRFNQVADSNENWMLKFQLSYPKLFEKIPLSKLSKLSWKQELKKRIKFKKFVRQEVEMMSEKFFTKTELSKSDFHQFDDILVQHHHDRSNVHLYITDELAHLIHRTERLEDMTTKYYSSKSIQHVKHSILRPQASSWPQMEEEGRLTYEDILITIAQWSQPTLDISTHVISSQLDSLASRLLADLQLSSPRHPIFTAMREEQEMGGEARLDLFKLPNFNGNLTENAWSSQDSKEILKSANNLLYGVEGYVGNNDDYYNADNSYVNCILEKKQGIPISLCLLYSCLLSRLGVLCLPVNFPGHFLLKWQEHPEEQDPNNRFTFIDAFSGGRELTGQQARNINMAPPLTAQDDVYQVAGPLAVAQRMLRNLISIGASRSNNMRDPSYGLLRSSLELMLILNTSDTLQYGFMLSRVYLQLNINHEDVMNMLQEYRDIPGIGDQVDYLMNACQIQMDERSAIEPEPEIKKRGATAFFPYGEVSMKVGQVCRHKKYNYVCVIYGWDTHCRASKSWISQMGVDKLDKKDKQPFYNVLVSDGSNRYAAQENIGPITPEEVTHPEVGKYFHSFLPVSGYLANSQLEKAYPDEEM